MYSIFPFYIQHRTFPLYLWVNSVLGYELFYKRKFNLTVSTNEKICDRMYPHSPVCVCVWFCCPPSHLSPTAAKGDHRGGIRNHNLLKGPGTGKQFSHHNGRSKHTWFSQCVILSTDDLLFSSPSWERTNTGTIVWALIWTLLNTRGLHCHANSQIPELQMDLYLLNPL